jgi:hypothetical protein
MRAYFCLTHDAGRSVPTLHVNGQELRLSDAEFFRLMREAAWVAENLNRHACNGYDRDGNYHDL